MRFRPRISLRLFLLLTILCAAAMGWFTVTYLERYRHEAALVDRLAALGGEIDRAPREPQWLWSLFGRGVAQRAASLQLADTRVTDAELVEIGELHELEALYLDRTRVSNLGLGCIRDLNGLVGLSLRQLKISDPPPLAAKNKLIELNLAFTDVSRLDTVDLISLESLNLRATQIDDETLAAMSALPRLKTLDIAGAPNRKMRITDFGVTHLTRQKYPKLTRLYLYETEVSDAAVEELKTRLPGLAVYRHETIAAGGADPRPAAARPGLGGR